MAVLWTIKHFRPNVAGRRFAFVTDCSALTWLFRSRNLDPKLHKWALSLQKYDIDLRWRAGSVNLVPDCLSSLPHQTQTDSHINDSCSGNCVGHTRSESTNRDISTSRAAKQRYPSEANHNEWGRKENISGARPILNRRDVPCQTRLYSKKMTAFELLFGRKPRTSLDSLVPLLDGATQTPSVSARLKPVRRSGRIGQSSVHHYLARGSKQRSDPCQHTTAQAFPKPSGWTLRIRA